MIVRDVKHSISCFYEELVLDLWHSHAHGWEPLSEAAMSFADFWVQETSILHLAGWCPQNGCTYRHLWMTIADRRHKTIMNELEISTGIDGKCRNILEQMGIFRAACEIDLDANCKSYYEGMLPLS
jgi:hypothetical protein